MPGPQAREPTLSPELAPRLNLTAQPLGGALLRVAVFSTKPYDQQFPRATNRERRHNLRFLKARLTVEMADLAEGAEAVCA